VHAARAWFFWISALAAQPSARQRGRSAAPAGYLSALSLRWVQLFTELARASVTFVPVVRAEFDLYAAALAWQTWGGSVYSWYEFSLESGAGLVRGHRYLASVGASCVYLTFVSVLSRELLKLLLEREVPAIGAVGTPSLTACLWQGLPVAYSAAQFVHASLSLAWACARRA
jgi:hypothetical protein